MYKAISTLRSGVSRSISLRQQQRVTGRVIPSFQGYAPRAFTTSAKRSGIFYTLVNEPQLEMNVKLQTAVTVRQASPFATIDLQYIQVADALDGPIIAAAPSPAVISQAAKDFGIDEALCKQMLARPSSRHHVSASDIMDALKALCLDHTRQEIFDAFYGKGNQSGPLSEFKISAYGSDKVLAPWKQFEDTKTARFANREEFDEWLNFMFNAIVGWRENLFFGAGVHTGRETTPDMPLPSLWYLSGWAAADRQLKRITYGRAQLEKTLPSLAKQVVPATPDILGAGGQDTFNKLQKALFGDAVKAAQDRPTVAPARPTFGEFIAAHPNATEIEIFQGVTGSMPVGYTPPPVYETPRPRVRATPSDQPVYQTPTPRVRATPSAQPASDDDTPTPNPKKRKADT